jgi:hypothetical protein
MVRQNDKFEQLAANNLTPPQDAIASLLQRLVYARHGRDCMGCKSPVRDWEPEGDR